MKGIDNMKKVGKIIILLLILMTIPVKAANYDLKELIPNNVKTTIVTNNFSYQNFYYNEKGNDGHPAEYIIFDNLKNISREALPVSISIGLFDENKKNIGVINHCSTKDEDSNPIKGKVLASKEEMSYVIAVNKIYLADDKTVKDIRYISVLSDNINCRTGGSLEFIGETVEEIGMRRNTGFDNKTLLLFKVLGGLAAVLLVIFLYRFLFTSSYQNVDGSDVRQGYKQYNKELSEERERELKKNPPKPKPKKKVKTDQVIQQEEEAKKEDKTGTDLHNLYK